jgi:hypothetical protein
MDAHREVEKVQATITAAARMLMNNGVINPRGATNPQKRKYMKVLMSSVKKKDGGHPGKRAVPVGGTVIICGSMVHGKKAAVIAGKVLHHLGAQHLLGLMTTQSASVVPRVAEAVEATVVANPVKASHGQMVIFWEQGPHGHHALTVLAQWGKPVKISPLLLVGPQQSPLPASNSGSGEIVVRAREEEGAQVGARATGSHGLPELKWTH